MIEKGSFWVRIGDHGTPMPIITSLKDDFMAKHAFGEFFEHLLEHGIELSFNDLVEVVHKRITQHEPLGLVGAPERFFKGTLAKAILWERDREGVKDEF